ncbi:MAG: protein translocase subunit SecD [Acidobacteria bacterium]|nr:protein translocase subunit SecD [Acidobacteriota bacterium]
MRRFRAFTSLIVILVIAAGSLIYTFASGNKPLLGLDLQGGVSVVLKPKGTPESSAIDEAISIIRQRIDALGVAEPEITRQGDNILIQIPGVKDKERAIDLVGQTAELQFRPVLASLPAAAPAPDTTSTSTQAGGDSSTTTPDASTTVPESPSTTAKELGMGASVGELALGSSTPTTLTDGADEYAQADPSTSAVDAPVADAPAADATATDASATGATTAGDAVDPLAIDPATGGLTDAACSTALAADQLNPTGDALLPQCRNGVLIATYKVGPVGLTGSALDTARANLGQSGQWVVQPVFKDNADGIGKFNGAASQCFSKAATCPSGQLAIVLDGQVISAPSINAASFKADQIEISGSFNERTAKDLATALKYGALPVEFEKQQAQIVSATLGRDALHAGLIAGLVGLLLAAVYMIAFYRVLGLFAVLKLGVEGALLWTVISYLGTSSGLALTLAGITGIIVSIGVSLDSNVVYYEHLKEDIQNGRSIRSSTDRSFVSAFSTIVKADVASLIGAGILWWLTVGPVRGFAFYLGLSTLLDLVTSWAYMRPVVKFATSRRSLLRRPALLGLPAERRASDAGAAGEPVLTGAK